MKPTLSQVCTLPDPFADDVQHYSASGCRHLEVWFTKMEQALTGSSPSAVGDLLREHGLSTPVASYQGGLFQPDPAGFQESWITYEQRLACCAQVGISTLVVVGDIREEPTAELVERIRSRLAQLATAAAAHNVEVAFEFQARATFANNLQTAAALIDSVNHPALKLCLDLFHFSIGPSKLSDLELLSGDNLGHVQICDLADVPRELAADRDRILPGDGQFPVGEVMSRLREIGYARTVSIELMNPRIWQVGGRQFSDVAMASLKRLVS